jgi:hypothetical protein
MNQDQDGIEYLEELSSKINKYQGVSELGEELQVGIRLSKTNKGARTNARIESAQKKEPFDETETIEEELMDVEDDITGELINRMLTDIFGI